MFGGEESACIAVKDHLPEKDGIFAGLLVTEMIAASGKNLSEIRKALFREYGTLVGGQRILPRTPAREKRLKEFVDNPPATLGARKVETVEIKDGINLEFADDAWLHLRFSGTEPVIRCHARLNPRGSGRPARPAWSSSHEEEAAKASAPSGGSSSGPGWGSSSGDARDVLFGKKGYMDHQDPESPFALKQEFKTLEAREERARVGDPRATVNPGAVEEEAASSGLQ
jgi:hypothetical protein